MWNVNAVLMGGLGKDPIIAEAQGLCHDAQKNLYVFNQRERDRQRENTFSFYTNNCKPKLFMSYRCVMSCDELLWIIFICGVQCSWVA